MKHNFLPPSAMPPEEEIRANYATIQETYAARSFPIRRDHITQGIKTLAARSRH